MMMETVLSRSIRLMFTGGVMMSLGLAAQAQAQQVAVDNTPAVEITGSSIQRIAKEGALPVQIITQEEIRRTGATSATELLQALPAMQNFVPASSSINGGGGGATTAALHSLPSKYTLVLLDGHRMAPVALGASQGGGFGVNIESIPLDAVERVEILTDGASALYGSDAIAGVVNFILKKNKTDGSAFVNYQIPQKSGGKSYSFGASKGFGDIDQDRFNVLLSYSHDDQSALAASQREASARGAFIPFSSGGQNYFFDQRTGNTEPANITFQARPKGSTGPFSGYAINPYYAANGNCGTPLAGPQFNPGGAVGVSCRFNYAATVQDIPSSKRDSGLIKGTLRLNDDTTAYAELVLSQFTLTGQFAPSAQPLGLNGTTRLPNLYNAYVQSYLDANNLEGKGRATLGYRSVAVGGRADAFQTDARHFVVGIDGKAVGWTYNANLTLSNTEIKDTATGGYTDFDKFRALVADGTYNPVLGTNAESLRPALLNGYQFSKTKSDLNTLHLGAQHDVMELGGGMSIASIGGDYSRTHYKVGYSDLILSQSGFSTQPTSDNFPVGGNYGQVPFDASRNNYGVFGELLLPLTKTLETTLSARYDHYGTTRSKYVFDTAADPVTGLQNQLPDADLGKTSSAATFKASFRWTPMDAVLLRGAYGTGFKAPNISDIAGATTFGGSTAGSYACPFPGSAGCMPGNAQYDLLSGPNGTSGDQALKPEKSKQWTIGFRVDPLRGLSLGADLWNVKITNQVLSAGIAEQVGFANPQTYQGLFINPYQDPAGFTTIGYLLTPINGGEANYRGVDWDFAYRTKTPYGDLATAWSGTYMLKQNYTDSPGGEVHTDLGQFGPDNAVVFRVQTRIAASMKTGPFTNALIANYKSGYKDQEYPVGTSIFLANPDGTRGASTSLDNHRVSSYATFDYQGKYAFSKQLTLTAGIKNLLDRKPPFTLQNAGGGNQIGYDGRYADPLGRAFYLTANATF